MLVRVASLDQPEMHGLQNRPHHQMNIPDLTTLAVVRLCSSWIHPPVPLSDCQRVKRDSLHQRTRFHNRRVQWWSFTPLQPTLGTAHMGLWLNPCTITQINEDKQRDGGNGPPNNHLEDLVDSPTLSPAPSSLGERRTTHCFRYENIHSMPPLI
ncbi:hypothetical protein NFI96_010157 [Prochilodus magdalenae]|nr:hypothetical protein NFI96_010157 [Prochilodus magdalenae]